MQRQSILNRKCRPSRANEENFETEFQREQARQEARAARIRQLEEDRLKELYGSREEKSELQRKRLQEMEDLLAIKMAQKQEELYEDEKIMEAWREQVAGSEEADAGYKEERKEFFRKILEENRKLVNYKKQLEKQQRNSEIEEERNRTEFAARFATSLR